MKVIFAGTPQFAVDTLQRLLHSKHKIVGVLTQPDRPRGRGLKMMMSPVKLLALNHELPIFQAVNLKDSAEVDRLRALQADAMVVAAYGLLLPASVLDVTSFGCINIHPSLLPRWRGAAPIPRTLEAGDKETGVTIMQMDQGLDTGPILLQKKYHVTTDETSETLLGKLAALGADALIETLDSLESGTIVPTPQNSSGATYAHKINKEEGLLDWTQPAIILEQIVRAFNPWPVAYTTWQGQNLRIWFAKAMDDAHEQAPRTLLRISREGLDIAAGDGVLRLLQVQEPGGKVLSIADFYNAKASMLKVGEHFI